MRVLRLVLLLSGIVAGPASAGLGDETKVEGLPVSFFGTAIAASETTVVVGAQGDGVDGIGTGSAYVYERDGDAWNLVQRLSAVPPANGENFGVRVGLSGDRIVVSSDGAGFLLGSTWLFGRNVGGPDNWGLVKKLGGGEACAIDGDTAVAGTGAGVSVFARDHGGPDNWGIIKIFQSSDFASGDGFGAAVDLDGDLLIVGSPTDDDGGNSSGSAYLFGRDVGGPDNWGEITKITASDPEANVRFGIAVAISGSTAIVGSNRFASQPTSAYVFERDLGGPDAWGEAKKLDSPNAEPFALDWFGLGVAIDGDRVLVGASQEDDGAAYLFERDAGGLDQWGLVKQLAPSDADSETPRQGFGRSVALVGDAPFVGSNLNAAAYFYEPSCHDAPAACIDAWNRGTLVMNESKTGREKFRADLIGGPALEQLDLGQPLEAAAAPYKVCLYDDSGSFAGGMLVDRSGDACDGGPCWKSLGKLPPDGRGYLYRDRERSADGILRLQLKGGSAGKSRIGIRGDNNAGNDRTALPTGIAGRLSGASDVTVQIHGDGMTQCLSATYDDIRKDTGEFFRARR